MREAGGEGTAEGLWGRGGSHVSPQGMDSPGNPLLGSATGAVGISGLLRRGWREGGGGVLQGCLAWGGQRWGLAGWGRQGPWGGSSNLWCSECCRCRVLRVLLFFLQQCLKMDSGVPAEFVAKGVCCFRMPVVLELACIASAAAAKVAGMLQGFSAQIQSRFQPRFQLGWLFPRCFEAALASNIRALSTSKGFELQGKGAACI